MFLGELVGFEIGIGSNKSTTIPEKSQSLQISKFEKYFIGVIVLKTMHYQCFCPKSSVLKEELERFLLGM